MPGPITTSLRLNGLTQIKASRLNQIQDSNTTREAAIKMGWWDSFKDFFQFSEKKQFLGLMWDLHHSDDRAAIKALCEQIKGMATTFDNINLEEFTVQGICYYRLTASNGDVLYDKRPLEKRFNPAMELNPLFQPGSPINAPQFFEKIKSNLNNDTSTTLADAIDIHAESDHSQKAVEQATADFKTLIIELCGKEIESKGNRVTGQYEEISTTGIIITEKLDGFSIGKVVIKIACQPPATVEMTNITLDLLKLLLKGIVSEGRVVPARPSDSPIQSQNGQRDLSLFSLPAEIQAQIAQYLGPSDLAQFSYVCRKANDFFWDLVSNPTKRDQLRTFNPETPRLRLYLRPEDRAVKYRPVGVTGDFYIARGFNAVIPGTNYRSLYLLASKVKTGQLTLEQAIQCFTDTQSKVKNILDERKIEMKLRSAILEPGIIDYLAYGCDELEHFLTLEPYQVTYYAENQMNKQGIGAGLSFFQAWTDSWTDQS